MNQFENLKTTEQEKITGSMNRDVVLRTKGIGKYFHEPVKFKVLDNISFEAYKGEFLTLVGKSGSGKSTLLYCLSTMDTTYEGELFIENEKITGKKTDELAALRNKSIGFIFQFHQLLPEFTAIENICLPALIKGLSMNEAKKEAVKLLDLLGLSSRGEHKPSELSGGEQQRVAVARSLINRPKVIFADEPSGNLDSHNSQELHKLFFVAI
jgi:lipoprotein-releasing system ATP-binding protein